MPSPRRPQQLGALALLCALALQLSLPVAHASAHAACAASAVVAAHASQPELRAHAASPDAGDPAACPICQSIHAKPAALAPAPAARASSAPEAAFVATAQRILADATHRAHAPRAPPLEALSLA